MDQFYKEIVSFQHRCNDYIDDHAHTVARSLKQEVQRLEDETQVRKNARSLESRVVQVSKWIESAGQNGVMSLDHVRELVRRCEDFQMQLRRMS